MKKLLNLKESLTVSDAARHLSILFEGDVSEADVFQLALDGQLKLSANFVNLATGRCGRVVPIKDAKQRTILSPDGKEQVPVFDGLRIDEDRVFEYQPEIVRLEGVWDLSMIGAERLDVARRYQSLTGGPKITLTNVDGPILCRADGTYCQIMDSFAEEVFVKKKNVKTPLFHPDDYYPADGLPKDSVLVVRTAALQELEARLSQPDQRAERALERRERTTLLVMIAALAKIAKVDVTKASAAAATIESETNRMGARVAARTIENHLKSIPEAMDRRKED